MIYKTREGKTIRKNDGQDRLLAALYGCLPGRMLVKLLIHPAISRVGGAFLDSRLSAWLISPFVRGNGMDLSCYEGAPYRSYNAFFTRRIRAGERPADMAGSHFISPCDAKLSVYPVTEEGVFHIKHTCYSLESLLRSKALAGKYYGGLALVFRLTVDDYHHYCYVDDGRKSPDRRIAGVLHTVNPAANDVYPVYKENSRTYSLLQSAHFGTILMMEVGALMVGKIVNYDTGAAKVTKGQEKGHFAFGGSTVLLLLEPGSVRIDRDILENSRVGCETLVRMGEKIGGN